MLVRAQGMNSGYATSLVTFAVGRVLMKDAEHFIVGTPISSTALKHTYMNSGEQILQTKPFMYMIPASMSAINRPVPNI